MVKKIYLTITTSASTWAISNSLLAGVCGFS